MRKKNSHFFWVIIFSALLSSACPWTGKDFCDTSMDCLDDYYCSNQGHCVLMEPDAPCKPAPIDHDRCDAHSVCVDLSFGAEKPVWRCQQAQTCPASGACRQGICNNGFVLSKARICLTQRCFDDGNCDSTESCAQVEQSFGICHGGHTQEPCTSDEHCWASYVCTDKDPDYSIGLCTDPGDLTCAERGGQCTNDYCPTNTHLVSNECPESGDSCCL